LGVLQKLTVERESLYKEVADMVIDVTERSPESVVSLIVSAVEVSYDE
jgi:shikimate kinase